MNTQNENKLLSPAEVASMLGVSPITVRSWVNKGWLVSKLTPGGHRRFLLRDIEQFIADKSQKKISAITKILIVDDDAPFRGFLLEALNFLTSHCEIRVAIDGFQAGLELAEFHPDLVLLDYAMPGMDGAAVCKSIKSNDHFSQTRIVAITGHAMPEIEQKLLSAGADEVAFKPVTLHKISEILNSLSIPQNGVDLDNAI